MVKYIKKRIKSSTANLLLIQFVFVAKRLIEVIFSLFFGLLQLKGIKLLCSKHTLCPPKRLLFSILYGDEVEKRAM